MTMLNNVTGSSSALDPYSAATREPTRELDRMAFLNLLMAQLQHQDPLNPMEDTEFTAQLAQFSSLEQLNNINEGIQGLNESAGRQDVLGAVSFIGKEVRAYGTSVSKETDSATQEATVSKVYYDIEESVADMYVNIYDSYGILVRTEKIGARQAGSYEFQWDGKDHNGSPLSDGVYSVAIAAESSEGQPIMVYTEVSGKVSGVSTEGGMPIIRLADGRKVNFFNIKEIVGDGSSTNTQSDQGDAG